MKTIKEYIDKWQPSYKISNEYIYEQLEDFYGEENIPDDLLESFKNGTLKNIGYDYITENLKTHDYKKLQNQLLKE